jgi:hypothetical protein
MPELISEVKVERCLATYTPNGGSATPLGLTLEGSKLMIKGEAVKVACDELGVSTIDVYGNGVEVSAELQMMQVSIDKLLIALSSVKTTDTTKHTVGVDPRGGVLRTYGKLVLHPRDLAANVVTRDWTIWKAAIDIDFLAEYTGGKALTWPLKMIGCVDQNASTGLVRIAQFGDSTVDKYYDVLA